MLPKKIVARLSRGLGAHGVLQGTMLFMRLAEIPLFLTFWGAQSYGEWLMLSALPSALALSDGGFTKATGREMAIRTARNDIPGAVRAFQSGWVMLLALTAIVLSCIFTVIPFLPVSDWLGLKTTTNADAIKTLIILSCQAFVSFQCALLHGGFSSTGSYAKGTLYLALSFAMSFAGLSIGVAMQAGCVYAAAGALTGSILSYLIILMALRRHNPTLRYGFPGKIKGEIKSLLAPSLANLAFPIGEMLNIQGTRLIVGTVFGPTALVAFSTTRTLCRMALQPVLSIPRTIEPEISIAHGEGNTKQIEQLTINGTRTAATTSALLCLLLLATGPDLIKAWTNDSISIPQTTFHILLLASLINSTWCVPLAHATAINKHTKLSIWFFTTYGIACTISTYIISKFLGESSPAIGLLLSELLFAIGAIKASSTLMGRSALRFVLDILMIQKNRPQNP